MKTRPLNGARLGNNTRLTLGMSATEPTVIDCQNLDEAIDKYTTQLGYRLDMIMPADAPREALLTNDIETLRLVSEPPALAGGRVMATNDPPAYADGSDPSCGRSSWVTGRAGMEYRDLIPGRLGGKVIASHIRLTKGGDVPDYVHYHKVDFQMIYCKRGRIRVVYEDQGPPFWLETGDCVLQPPEIRHRVLECTAGAEVIEVSMPAEHETWVEHEIELPTGEFQSERSFSGQRFVHHIAATSNLQDNQRNTGIALATDGFADVFIIRDETANLDIKLLLTFRRLNAKCDSLLPAPVSLEIAV